MAAAFMCSFATLGLRIRAVPSAFVWLTDLLAAALLLSVSYALWVALVFPMWVQCLPAVYGLGIVPESAR